MNRSTSIRLSVISQFFLLFLFTNQYRPLPSNHFNPQDPKQRSNIHPSRRTSTNIIQGNKLYATNARSPILQPANLLQDLVSGTWTRTQKPRVIWGAKPVERAFINAFLARIWTNWRNWIGEFEKEKRDTNQAQQRRTHFHHRSS